MTQYPVDDRLILNAGDHFSLTATLWAHRDINVEYPFQALCPGHGLVVLFRGFVFDFLTGASFAAFGWRHINTVFAVGGKYAMEPGQVHSGFRHQCRQLGNEIQRLRAVVGSAVVVGRRERVSDGP